MVVEKLKPVIWTIEVRAKNEDFDPVIMTRWPRRYLCSGDYSLRLVSLVCVAFEFFALREGEGSSGKERQTSEA